MGLSDQEDDFKRKMGEILRITLNIESFLDFAITTYFMGHSQGEVPFENKSGKRAFFQELIAFKLNFDKKNQIFKEICDRKNYDKIKTKETIDNISFITKLRNKVAHDDMRRTDKEGPYLVKRDSLAPYNYKIFLTDELMKEVQDKWADILKNVIEISNID